MFGIVPKLFPRPSRIPGARRRSRPRLEALDSRVLPDVGLAATLSADRAPLLVELPGQADHVRVASTYRSVMSSLPGSAVRAEYDSSRGELQVVGTNGDDELRVVESEGRLGVEKLVIVDQLHKKGQFRAIDIETNAGPVRSIDASTVKRIDLVGWGGNDTLTFEYDRPPQEARGLLATRARAFTLGSVEEGSFSANLVVELSGGDGDDKLTVSGSGAKDWGRTYGGPGRHVNPVTLRGGDGDDTLTGSIGDELLEGGADNDTLIGNEGNDELHGNGGHDTIYGDADHAPYHGTGQDQLFGDAGSDTLHGGGGDDVLKGGSDVDYLHGDDGNDVLRGGSGDDVLKGDLGADSLHGELGSDHLFGGPRFDPTDYLYGGQDKDFFHYFIDYRAPSDKLAFVEGEDEKVVMGEVVTPSSRAPMEGFGRILDPGAQPDFPGPEKPKVEGPKPSKPHCAICGSATHHRP